MKQGESEVFNLFKEISHIFLNSLFICYGFFFADVNLILASMLTPADWL